MTSQIDRLDPADRTVLRYAAVLGMVVDEDTLESLLRDTGDNAARHGAMQRLSQFFVRDKGAFASSMR